MSLYWFWFLFPTALSIAVTAFEMDYVERKNAQPRFALIFFVFTGIPALIPGWTAFYSGITATLGEILVPAAETGTLIADFTITAAALFLLGMHCVLVFALIPVQLAKLIQRLRKA
jgi:hypothetical protein